MWQATNSQVEENKQIYHEKQGIMTSNISALCISQSYRVYFYPPSSGKTISWQSSIKLATFFFCDNPTLCPVTTLKAYESSCMGILELSGVNTSIINAHSVRGASLSKATNLTKNDILKTANWSSESVFQTFIIKHHKMQVMVEQCSIQTTPLKKYVRLSPLKYNS